MSQDLLKPSGEILARRRGGGLQLWLLAVVVGLVAGAAVVVFRGLVIYAELNFYQRAGAPLAAQLAELPWLSRLLAPFIGGVCVALVLRLGISLGWGPAPRPFGHSELVAARRLRASLRASTLALKDSALSALASIISLGSGASVGREGPLMHLAASLGLLHGRLLGLDLPARRILVGMGAAAGLAAALHTPFAAVLLARELVLPRLRFQALGPVALSSVSGWLLADQVFGGMAVLAVPSLTQSPGWLAFAGLVVAIPVLAAAAWASARVWLLAPDVAARLSVRIGFPVWALPAVGGAVIGVLYLAFPLAAGLGYGPAAIALAGGYGAALLILLALTKVLASLVAFAARFGGGPIAPAAYVGIMTGTALGALAGLVGLGAPPDMLVFFGMIGASVALAVLLEAPIAAGILSLELSQDVAVGSAGLVAALLATFLVRRYAPRSEEPLPRPFPAP